MISLKRSTGIVKPSKSETSLNAQVKVYPSTNASYAKIVHPLPTGGWDRSTNKMSRDLATQMNQAFENVDHNLKNAGGKGWSEVYKVVSYHVPINDEAVELFVENMKKYCPDHQPCWTCVGVQRLGQDDMRIEIDVTAHCAK